MLRQCAIGLALCVCVVFAEAKTLAQNTAPLGAGPYNLIVVTAPTPSPRAVRLLDQITNDPAMASLARYCQFTKLQTGTVMYEERYSRALPARDLPIIAFADANGGVIYKASGANIPNTGGELAEAIVKTNREFQQALAGQRLASRGMPHWSHWSTLYQSQEQCPNCPQPNAPTQPNRPDRPNRPNPLTPLLDEVIPDTVTVTPTVSIGNGLTVPIVVGVVVLIFAVFGGIVVLLALAGLVAWYVWS